MTNQNTLIIFPNNLLFFCNLKGFMIHTLLFCFCSVMRLKSWGHTSVYSFLTKIFTKKMSEQTFKEQKLPLSSFIYPNLLPSYLLGFSLFLFFFFGKPLSFILINHGKLSLTIYYIYFHSLHFKCYVIISHAKIITFIFVMFKLLILCYCMNESCSLLIIMVQQEEE